MNIDELIANAQECAHDALVLIDAATKLKCNSDKLAIITRAAALLKVGHDEALRAKEVLS